MINEGLAFGKGTDTYMLATQLQNKLKKGKGVSGIQLADLMLQSYTDAAKTEGRHKGITMPQIDLSRTTGTILPM